MLVGNEAELARIGDHGGSLTQASGATRQLPVKACVRLRTVQVGAIEDIEPSKPELQPATLSKGKGFEKRHVPLIGARPAERRLLVSSKLTDVGKRERKGVQPTRFHTLRRYAPPGIELKQRGDGHIVVVCPKPGSRVARKRVGTA